MTVYFLLAAVRAVLWMLMVLAPTVSANAASRGAKALYHELSLSKRMDAEAQQNDQQEHEVAGTVTDSTGVPHQYSAGNPGQGGWIDHSGRRIADGFPAFIFKII